MIDMRILQALIEKPLQGIFSAIGIFLLTPLIQMTTTPLAFKIWYLTLLDRPLNTALYLVFSILFGLFISLYLYTRNRCLNCNRRDVSAGFGGATLGFVLGVCPACFSLIGALLPLSGSILLTAYSPLFTVLSIGIIIFSIHRLGGFALK
ncbi:MAG: hypothetical protein HYX24_01825 [Candidatus Aenigmarchaeota archaeon]|nr:hypothetical protein [Candidatus Aenigmarchaeota archaeon]